MRHLDLFSGIGGFSRAADFLDWETTDFAEQSTYCQQVLKKHYPNARIHSDVTTYRGTKGSHQIITGGFPCQDVSLANTKRKGLEGDRSILFYEAGRIIYEVFPLGFCLENVPGIYKYLSDILAYFAKGGLYEIRWFSLRVNQLGGSHRRERVFILGKLANPKSIYESRTKNNQKRTDKTIIGNSTENGKQDRKNQPKFCCTDDGFSDKLVKDLMTPPEARNNIDSSIKQLNEWDVNDNQRLKALGNAVTPQQAYVALKALEQWICGQEK
jgi:DNA (cytosine-5)-methyltransferase 1